MNSCVKLCIFLFLTEEGTRGLELTINVRKNASVTLTCSSTEKLEMCNCPSYPQKCHLCTEVIKQVPSSFESYKAEKYWKLSGLKYSNSGLYACSSLSSRRIGKKYRLNVFEDQDPTVVIGTVGQSIVMSCGTELDIMAASEKRWCHLRNGTDCQPDTIMGPKSESRGNFKILDSHGSFSLEKRQLTHNDTGFYRCTQIFQNHTKVHVVELQVKDKHNFLQISPVRVNPEPDERFEIICQYSQDLQEFSKSWLCDDSECPETVRSVDDRFQSALVLTIDHVACSNIRYFRCVAKRSGAPSERSNVYLKPLNQNPIVDVEVSSNRKVQVKAYTQLNLICLKPDRHNWDYDRMGGIRWGRYDYYYYHNVQPYWCRVSPFQCLRVTENLKERGRSLILQICVTPNDDGTTYRCRSSRWNTDVQIVVIAAPPPPPPPPQAVTPGNSIPRSKEQHVGVIIIGTSIILLIIIILSVTVTKYKGPKLRERLFARRTPLSAVDVHANMYANSVAHYYSHHRRQVPTPDQQGEGDDKETSSSSDDEFEELPVRPKTSSSVMQEETDYTRIASGGEVLFPGSLGCSKKKEDDDEDEVTYTRVIIKPKHRLK